MLVVHAHVGIRPDRVEDRYLAVFPADAQAWTSGPP
jgi:hypothetical protein